MTIETINKRIAGKEKEIDKLTKKLERIHKAEATNWEVNPYYYNERDLKYTERDLEQAKKALAEYKEMLVKETEKAESRNVKALIDFLEQWKTHMREYYSITFEQYEVALTEYYEAEAEYCNWFNNGGWRQKNRKEVEREFREYKRGFHTEWAYMERYCTGHGTTLRLDTEKLDKDLRIEADRKYDNIIERTNEITGTITDATGLKVGAKGELDGYIIGEKGTAHVHTIGAGGYNIQCYHFRVLVHRVK